MEFVPLSSQVLRYLCLRDKPVSRHFQGVFAADQLPMDLVPPNGPRMQKGLIVNTDDSSKPGQHWLGVWMKDNVCEVFDSYGLPLHYYKDPNLQQWLRQWKYVVSSNETLQALDSQTCGHYAYEYLKAKARGAGMTDFLAQWGPDLVENDARVAEVIRSIVERELGDSVDGQDKRSQTNCSRQAFMTCNSLN